MQIVYQPSDLLLKYHAVEVKLWPLVGKLGSPPKTSRKCVAVSVGGVGEPGEAWVNAGGEGVKWSLLRIGCRVQPVQNVVYILSSDSVPLN